MTLVPELFSYDSDSLILLFLALFSHASSDRRGDYESVMEDIIPLENALMAKQKVC